MLTLAPILLAAAVPAADARFDAIWQSEWRWRVAEGLASDGSRKVEPRLPDVSPAAQARRRRRGGTNRFSESSFTEMTASDRRGHPCPL